MIRVTLTPDEKWIVERDGKTIAGPFATSAEAWRAADRLASEPISRSEQVSDWIWSQQR